MNQSPLQVFPTYAADLVRPACPHCGLAVTLPDDATDPTDYWVGRCPKSHVHL